MVRFERRNYLFADADSGGERAAAMYSLIGTARLNGLDPEAYLAYVLERIADHPRRRTASVERGAVAVAYCSRRAYPIVPRINLHFGTAQAFTRDAATNQLLSSRCAPSLTKRSLKPNATGVGP